MVHLRFVDNRAYLGEDEIELSERMFLQNKNITEISGRCPDSVFTLYLGRNQISSLFGAHGEKFDAGNLRGLRLDNNKITSLFDENGNQFQTNNITTLTMENNLIPSLFNKDGVQFMPGKIRILDLVENKISRVMNELHEPFKPGNLKKIHLAGKPHRNNARRMP